MYPSPSGDADDIFMGPTPGDDEPEEDVPADTVKNALNMELQTAFEFVNQSLAKKRNPSCQTVARTCF